MGARTILISVLFLVGLPGWATPTTRPRLVVMYFEDNTGRKEWSNLPKALAGMLTTDLAKLSTIQVLEREKLESLLKEINLQKGKFFDPRTVQQLGRGLGAQYALGGSIFCKGNQLRFDARIIRVETAEVVKTADISGEADQIFLLEKKLVAALGMATIQDVKILQEGAKPDQHPVVVLQDVLGFGRSLQLGDEGELMEASQVLKGIVARSPKFKPAEEFYHQVLNDLIFARRQRISDLDKTIQSMNGHVHQALEESRPFAIYLQRAYAIRVLRGQILLVALRETLSDPNREYDYLPQLVQFIENQLDLAEECQLVHSFTAHSGDQNRRRFQFMTPSTIRMYVQNPSGQKARHDNTNSTPELLLEAPEKRAAAELGIKLVDLGPPLNAYQVKRDLARFILQGIPPRSLNVGLPMEVCWFKRSKTLESLAFELLEEAMQSLMAEGNPASSDEAVQILKIKAEGQLNMGRPELAINTLKRILENYPQSKQFESTENLLRRILNGDDVTHRCIDPPPSTPPKTYPFQVHEPSKYKAVKSATSKRVVGAFIP